MAKTKVLFTVFTTTHGNGGHFYSLVTTARALAEYCEVVIVNLGFNMSPVILNSGLRHHHIPISSSGLRIPLKNLKQIIRVESPDVLHSFCTLSYLFIRLSTIFKKKRIIHTKCGGPNPKRYFPFTRELILYSGENKTYFESKRKFRTTNIYLIPNRAVRIKADTQRMKMLLEAHPLPDDHKVFLRIGRISKHYETSIHQCISLVSDLNARKYRSCLLLIGSVQDESVRKRIEKLVNSKIILVSSQEFTAYASGLIDLGHFILGTGRSLMEAASLDKILLTPNSSTRYPVLVTEEIIDQLIYSNFSPRNNINTSDKEILDSVITLFEDNHYKEHKKNAGKIYAKYFDISTKSLHYNNLYLKLKPVRTAIGFDLLSHYLFVRRYVYNNCKKNT